MLRTDRRPPLPLLAAFGAVALTLGGLLVGYEPVGDDPDVMYRPMKSELARALRRGNLPFWSDLFGVGTPLVAESHVAAFYPPNWALYRVLGVSAAYRLSMWCHYLAVVAATYLYARALRLTVWGAGLAALAFALCGFQAAHACHEPLYHLMPYLPLSLYFAERYLADGRFAWLAALALAIGVQVTLGHFQIQAWTAVLVVLSGLWRVVGWEASWRRGAAVALAVAWGLAVASVQLGPTRELTRLAGFDRPPGVISGFAFPPGSWAQPALPRLYAETADAESYLYVGTVPLILAGAGWLARRDRALGLWRLLAPSAFLLATMPYWYREGFLILARLPVIGHFRAPGRYTLLTGLGLCLLAGRGFDRAMGRGRFWAGYAIALAFGAAAFAWVVGWPAPPVVATSSGQGATGWLIAEGAATWIVAIGVVAAWRSGRASPWLPFLVAACELAFLFHRGPTSWGRSARYPDDSPVLRRLVQEERVGRVTGWVRDIPVRLGMATADPYLGITPPPPNYLLESIVEPSLATDWDYRPWVRRFGITHGVIDDAKKIVPGEVLYRGEDPMLRAAIPPLPGRSPTKVWRLERYEGAFPEARAALRVHVTEDWYEIFPRLSRSTDPDEVWFLREDQPPDPPGPRARSARVVRWDGRSGEVEHDGTCDLVLLRAYYPGWSAQLDGGPEVPVARADGGFQSVRLPGAGVTRVTVRYRPTHFGRWVTLSIGSAAAAVAVLAAAAARRPRRPPANPDATTTAGAGTAGGPRRP